MRYDMVTGGCDRYDTDAVIGEVVFAPRTGSADELDGHYLTFARSIADDRSWLVENPHQFGCSPL
jgi:carotenoid cleavage dioxygenase-like enzyme